MKLPPSAADNPELKASDLPEGEIFTNPFHGKEMLTFDESLECIYMLSSMMRIDCKMRKH